MVVIIDYNVGNVKSIQNMLKRIGVAAILSANPEEILNAKKLILPGVGHFDYGMQMLRQSNLIEILNKKVLAEKTPILGICLGAQLLGNQSDEGKEKGLGWIDMDVVKFDKSKMDKTLKIPHMSWNEVEVKKASILFPDKSLLQRFYFVHSYHMLPRQTSDVLTITNYGYNFVSAVEKNNIFGVQFHPEKSHKFGMNLLKNFVSL